MQYLPLFVLTPTLPVPTMKKLISSTIFSIQSSLTAHSTFHLSKHYQCLFCQLVTSLVLKYEKHFPKMYRDVGMAVPKTTQTRYMDGTVQATQRTTQVTPSLHQFSFLLSAQSCFQYSDNKS